MIAEALVLIFNKLSIFDKICMVSLVCKSWHRVVTCSDCWQDIDFEGIEDHYNNDLKPILKALLRKNSDHLRSLCAKNFVDDELFSLFADHAQSVRTLKLSCCSIRSSTIETAAEKLSTVTHLDISFNCYHISASAIKAIGYHCKHLLTFNMNVSSDIVDIEPPLDEQAFAIASTMPKLKHLEVSYVHIGSEGLLKILSCCTELEFLNIRGCFLFVFKENLFENFSGLKVIGPWATGEDLLNYMYNPRYIIPDFMAIAHELDFSLFDELKY
ncbi:F-box protein FBW2-like [Humulus lupulus]|uniref:F-box protein FBW2-like n=1 Tax=Humulus lupulus TaxID=3486 RepID=UPI002B41615C|nr:F-box protein FBW2-like [Humulus lupulus]